MPLIISHGEPPPLTFFADASSKGSDYMVAGGFAVAGNRIAEIEHHIGTLRELGGISSEFHWAKYTGGSRRAAYEALVDYAFELTKKKHAALHIIVAKFKGYEHKAKPGENRDTSVNRMYYQLCLHRPARFYGKKRAIHIRLDAGNDCEDICEMQNELSAAAYNRYGTKPNCVRTVEPMASHKSGILQMADVIIGAVAAKRNGIQHTTPKGDLASYVLKASGRSSWDSSTPFWSRFFTVWDHKGKLGPP